MVGEIIIKRDSVNQFIFAGDLVSQFSREREIREN